VKERDAAAAAIDAEAFAAGVVPPPMQTQIQRMGGMSSAVTGRFYAHSPVVHELVAKFADMTAKETAKEHGWQLKEATAHQRHRIRHRLATGAWRDFHENKIVRLPYVDPSTEYARTLRHLQVSDHECRTHGGEQRTPERSRMLPLRDAGRREWAARQRATGPLAAPPPRSHSLGCGRAAGTPQREHFARGERSGTAATYRQAARTRCLGLRA
jgi:hypothetical protein